MSSTRTCPSWTSTERMTPRSTSETTGISGSGISPNADQTCSAVTTARPTVRSGAPSSSRSRARRARRCACRARRRRPALRPTRAASASRCSAGSIPSAYGHSSSTAARNCGVVREQLAPHLRVHAVVRLLAVDLRREAGHLRVVVLHQRRRCESRRRPRTASGARSRAPSRAGAARRTARTGTRRARGRTRARPRRPVQQLVHRARVADLVLRDRRERDVLLEHGRDARPLRVAPAEDELVVSEPEQELVHGPPSTAP